MHQRKVASVIDQHAYYADEDVRDFTQWVSVHAATLPIRLSLRSSRSVPGGLRKELTGLPETLANYVWKSKRSVRGDWAETVGLLSKFRFDLDASITAKDDDAAFEVCTAIIEWGGDRNPLLGATSFLQERAGEKDLVAYLVRARKDFKLDTATLAGELSVRKMNSMLTKVHALAADDGLPIYDSRVAAAIAALVEMWRRAAGRSAEALPGLLSFPATLRTRTVRHLYDTAVAPGVLLYGATNAACTARRWSEAKIRLGWLMQRILALQPKMFAGAAATDTGRMHALEASLFMVGYDVHCLQP